MTGDSNVSGALTPEPRDLKAQDRTIPRPTPKHDFGRPNRDLDCKDRATGKLYRVIDVTDNSSAPRLVIFDLDGTLYPRERYAELILAVIGRGFVELRGTTPGYAARKVAELRELMRTDWSGTSTTSFMIENGFGVEEWQDFREANLSIVDGIQPDAAVVSELKRLREVVPMVVVLPGWSSGFDGDNLGVQVAVDISATAWPQPEWTGTDEDIIVLTPQNQRVGTDAESAAMVALLESFMDQYSVDRERVYVQGFSWAPPWRSTRWPIVPAFSRRR